MALSSSPTPMPFCASLGFSSGQLHSSSGLLAAEALQVAQLRSVATANGTRSTVGSAELQRRQPEWAEKARDQALRVAYRPHSSIREVWRRDAASSGTVGYTAEEIWDDWGEEAGETQDWATRDTDATGARFPAGGNAGGACEDGAGESQSSGQAQAWALQEEALEALEWGRLCRAVASFASTPLGASSVASMRPAASDEEGLALLQETEAVLQLEARTGGTLDFGASNTSMVRSREPMRVLGLVHAVECLLLLLAVPV